MTTRFASARMQSAQKNTGAPALAFMQRKCGCGAPTSAIGGECEACRGKKLQRRSLAINAPGDRFEQEADRTAEAVMSGKHGPLMISTVASAGVQRDDPPKEKTDGEKYKEGLGKVGEAFLQTPLGKQILERIKQDRLVKGAGDFLDTLPGKIFTGASAVGAVSALAAAHQELPAQIPEIPLDAITPGLSVQITYNGPLDKPTDAAISFKFTEQIPKAGGDKKPALSPAEQYRAETARIAADQQTFRDSLRYPPDSEEDRRQKAEREALKNPILLPSSGPNIDAIINRYSGLSKQPTNKPGLQLTPPTFGNGGYQPPPLFGDQFRFKLPDELKLADPNKKDEDKAVQRKSTDVATPDAAPPSVLKSVESPGKPLDKSARSYMESRFGHDFSQVRIHDDIEAAASAKAVNASAYTVGQNIVFSTGQYAPGTNAGRRLLAHELTHVVQQDKDNSPRIQRDGPTPEQRAEQLPRQLSSGERSLRGESDDLPQPPGTPPSAPSAYICGPEIGPEINRVWTQIQTDFRSPSWSLPAKRNACLYLIQLFTPQTSTGTYAPPSSSLPVSLNKNGFDTLGLFQAGAGWQRRSPYHPRCGIPGTAAPPGASDFHSGHEDPERCSNTATVGGQCWLMGTINYGAFGVMMKLCHDELPSSEGSIIGEEIFASLERYIDQIQRSGQTIGQDVGAVIRLVVDELLRQLAGSVPEAASVVDEVVQYVINNPALVRRLGTAGAAGRISRELADAAITALLRSGALRRAGSAIGAALSPAGLFSRASLAAFVGGYKIFDADDPGPPLRWALATYDGGPGAAPSGGNRARCNTTCPLTYSGTPFDYVWEPTKPRRSWP